MSKDDMLDLIAKRRDFHIKAAADWLDLLQKYAQQRVVRELNSRDLSEASTHAERHNFAAHSFGLLLKELEK